ncbi:Uncharacterized protein QTN25_002635 [Entamoeba marina]
MSDIDISPPIPDSIDIDSQQKTSDNHSAPSSRKITTIMKAKDFQVTSPHIQPYNPNPTLKETNKRLAKEDSYDSKSSEASSLFSSLVFDENLTEVNDQKINLITPEDDMYEETPVTEKEKYFLFKLYKYMMDRKNTRKRNVSKDQTKSKLTSTKFYLIILIDFIFLYFNMIRMRLFEGYYESYILTLLLSCLLLLALFYGIPFIIYIVELLYILTLLYTTIHNNIFFHAQYNEGAFGPVIWIGLLIGVLPIFIIAVAFYIWGYPLVKKMILVLRTPMFDIQKSVNVKTKHTKYQLAKGAAIFMLDEINTDKLMKVSGMGTWVDNSFQGEQLAGYFDLGIPIGPFHSIESKTPNIFNSVRIIFASNSGGKLFIEKTKLGYGVASVECCVSGTFYKNYPLVNYVLEKQECTCRKRECFCVNNILKKNLYFHLNETKPVVNLNVLVDQNEGCLYVPGYYTKNSEKRKEITISEKNNQNYLQIDPHWTIRSGSLVDSDIEALLFIHGLDHTLSDSLRRIGQMLALGNFPQHIIPFVFNWPSSQNAFCYYCASNNASDRNQHRDFYNFLVSLRNAGVTRIHIMCHSLGSKFFMQSYLLVQTLFKKASKSSRYSTYFHSWDYSDCENFEKGSDNKMEFANLVLLNSDYEVETFVEDYVELKERCQHITIYSDQRDSALHVSNFLTKKRRLGEITKPLERNGVPLENIDIIDTSELDKNINEARHGFFNINKMMIDDLFDVIVNNKTASSRITRLVNVNGIYRFSLLPNFSKLRFS